MVNPVGWVVVLALLVEVEVGDDAAVGMEVVVAAHKEVPGVAVGDIVLVVVYFESSDEMLAVHCILGRGVVVSAMIGYMLEVVGDFLGLVLWAEVVDLEDIAVAVHHLAEEAVGDIAAAAEIGHSLAMGVAVVPGWIVGDCSSVVAYSSYHWLDVEHCHFHRKAEAVDGLALPLVLRMVMVGEHHIDLVSVLLDRNLLDRVLDRLERNPWVAEAVGRVRLSVIVNLERP